MEKKVRSIFDDVKPARVNPAITMDDSMRKIHDRKMESIKEKLPVVIKYFDAQQKNK